MKIQCACGTKYSFEVTPEMAAAPIRFVCQNCGADNSTVVNQLIRQQLGVEVPPSAPWPAVAPAPVIAPPPPSQRTSVAPTVQAASAAPVVRVAPAAAMAPASGGGPSGPPPAGAAPLRVSAPAASTAAPAVDAAQVCTKHAGQLTTHRCLVCQKPICPQCMALFGFVCSAYCKGKAESQGMDVPVYAGQRDVAQSRQWRKVGLISLAVALLVAAALGAWGWYAWVGSVPSVAFSTRFTEPGYSGQVRVCAPDQVVFLHGGTLARHDMKANKELWSQVLIDKPRISQEADKAYEEWKASWQKAQAAGADMSQWHYVTRDELHDSMLRAAAEVLHLHVRGENIWVASPGKLTRYEWPTGKPVQEIPMSEEREELTARGDELLLVAARPAGGRELTRINLASGESRAEDIDPPPPSAMAKSAGSARPGQTASRRAATNQLAAAAGTGKAGPIPPGAKPLDPAALAAKYENLPRPAKLALPAVVAASANQQRLQAALRDEDSPPPAALTALAAAAAAAALRNTAEADGRVILTPEGAVRISMRLLEAKTIERKVMKERPAKSALDGPINQAATAAIASELLNDMQRDRGADVVEEDVSRYQVTVRRAAGQDTMEWTGEVTGSADFIPLQTADVVVGGKALVVLDKKMKKLWEARLNYDVRAAPERGPDGELPPDGDGPCVERGDTLYVFDAGVLTAFDLTSGNVRWRLPSVETKGLFFDDAGMIYVNTTSATPDNLKYSRQIDVTDKIHPVVLKVEAKTGKTLWRVNNEGTVNYVSGKLVYTAESHPGDDDEADGLLGVNTIFHIPAHVRIKRLDAGNGRVLWQHYQPRYPLDVRYDQNSIHLLFKKEVQILKFIYL
jgi:hypothetical protein